MEKVKIETIQDIYDVITPENFDRFMADFYKMFYIAAQFKEFKDVIQFPYFECTDDGENRADFKIIAE